MKFPSRRQIADVAFFLVAVAGNPRLVTEAARIGFATTRGLLRTAYEIFVLLRDPERLEALAARHVQRDAIPADELWALEHSPLVLRNVHSTKLCAGKPCPIHNRSDHALRSWPQFFRQDEGFMERTCAHGVGHPDPDDRFAPGVHGCDGCCIAGDAAELGAAHLPEAS